jgi:uncharacterized protein (DUF488 family)
MHSPAAPIFTIGHSTRTWDEFVGVLKAHSIEAIADIRAFPMSRRMPHFNRDFLARSLPADGIRYVWSKALGGHRKKVLADSPNVALRNQSFRNYADYMLTGEFQRGITELIELANSLRTAYMCAERLYFRCHRMLVSDWLVAHGYKVLHIDGLGPTKPHEMMPEARIVNGQLVYRGDRLF